MRMAIPSAGTVRSHQMDVGWRWCTCNTYQTEVRLNTPTLKYGVFLAIEEVTVIGLR